MTSLDPTPGVRTYGRFTLVAFLILMGAGWGLTMPFTKIAVSEGHGPFGLIFWQLVITGSILTVLCHVRNRPLPLSRRHIAFFLLIALLGTVIPNSASYRAAAELPAGVMAITISTVPLFALPIAVAMRTDTFTMVRLIGLLCGFACILLMVGPKASLPDSAAAIFILVALIAPIFYGLEANVLAKWGLQDLDPIQLLAGASFAGAPIALVLAKTTGQWIDPLASFKAPEMALVASSIIHAAVYSSYFWMVRQAGPVFAAQVSYLVTGFGVAWSILLLSESYSIYVWAAMLLMLVGLFLVQPRQSHSAE